MTYVIEQIIGGVWTYVRRSNNTIMMFANKGQAAAACCDLGPGYRVKKVKNSEFIRP